LSSFACCGPDESSASRMTHNLYLEMGATDRTVRKIR
jgi:hypothetical protein